MYLCMCSLRMHRCYITVDDSWTDEGIAKAYEEISGHFPVTFVPRGYHGRSVVDRPV